MKLFFIGIGMLIVAVILWWQILSPQSIKRDTEGIATLVTQGCPKSAEMNYRFDMLYLKFGKGKKVPHKFVNGEVVNFENIYENMDYLIQDPDYKTATGTVIRIDVDKVIGKDGKIYKLENNKENLGEKR